ncbi:hypothetical protein GOV03_01220, partial [Candidatus Woesearchaeota archaeon]|nr:hypothetical protein [Candidatus Woesearchaeota archaeon]
FVPEGQKVKCDADGWISPQEESDLIKIFEAEKGIEGFTRDIQMVVNDFDKYQQGEFNDRGLWLKPIGKDLHILMVKNQEALRKKSKELPGSGVSEDVEGFYRGNNTTIYQPLTTDVFEARGENISLTHFIETFQHEVGHDKLLSDKEFSAQSNEYYFNLKMYSMNSTIGLEFLNRVLCEEWREKAGEFSDGYGHYYRLGCIALYYQANKVGGNLEKALEIIMNAPSLHTEKDLIEQINQKYPNLRIAYQSEFEELVTKEGFRDSFSELDNQEFSEIVDYWMAYVKFYTYLSNKRDETEYQENFDKAKELFHAFLDNHEHPNLRARVIRYLTFQHDIEKNKSIDAFWDELYSQEEEEVDWDKVDPLLREMYASCKTIIDLNQPFPCEYDYVECPYFASQRLPEHVIAYFDLLGHNNYLIGRKVVSIDELLDLGVEFVDKFYADGDFSYEKLPDTLAFAGIWTNYRTGMLFKTKAHQVITPEDYTKNCQMAKQFLEYVQAGSCEVVEDVEKREACWNHLRFNFYDFAQEQIDEFSDCTWPPEE